MRVPWAVKQQSLSFYYGRSPAVPSAATAATRSSSAGGRDLLPAERQILLILHRRRSCATSQSSCSAPFRSRASKTRSSKRSRCRRTTPLTLGKGSADDQQLDLWEQAGRQAFDGNEAQAQETFGQSGGPGEEAQRISAEIGFFSCARPEGSLPGRRQETRVSGLRTGSRFSRRSHLPEVVRFRRRRLELRLPLSCSSSVDSAARSKSRLVIPTPRVGMAASCAASSAARAGRSSPRTISETRPQSRASSGTAGALTSSTRRRGPGRGDGR